MLLTGTPAFAAGPAKAPRAAAVPPAPPPLRIGEIDTYQALPDYSTPYRRGWMLALEQINAEGGVLGHKLEVRSRDDHGDPDDAVRAAQALVEKDGVVALFGGYSSEVGLALSRYADTAKVLYLAVSPLTQRLTWQEGNRYTFRLRPAAWMQAAAVAPKALGLRKLRWALISQDTESDRATVDAFKGLLKTFQSKTAFVAEQAIAPGKFDAPATVAALAAAKPEAIFITLTGRDLASLADAGMAAHLFDGVGVVSLFLGEPENLAALDAGMPSAAAPAISKNPGIPSAARPAIATSAPAASPIGTPDVPASAPRMKNTAIDNVAVPDPASLGSMIPDGWIITGYPRDAVDTPDNQAFVQAYRDRYGDAPGMAAVLGYSALRSIAEGLKRAGSPDREALAAAFPRLQVPTPFGIIEYRNLDHQSTLGVYLGYTGHADGRLIMDRFVYATGARLQPLDEQIRRLRVQAARENTTRDGHPAADAAAGGAGAAAGPGAAGPGAAGAAGAAGPAGPGGAAGAGAAGAGGAGAAGAAGGAATGAPTAAGSGTAPGTETTGAYGRGAAGPTGTASPANAHPAADSAHPVTGASRPVVRPDTDLTARLRGARPGAAPATPAQATGGRAPTSATNASSSAETPANKGGAHAEAPLKAATPGLGTRSPALSDWPDQVGQGAATH
ncbi:ABC transporter substrate-binding protein [Bordetella sp. H567]|uniref:ABC transporter substrate-binding protein n=1 Tax=Bordetella sp. H567 TaxID=1697043 RepID=UPI0013145CED|nr:ABC transporter substrate-binding protein [Bordetella sp. H567]